MKKLITSLMALVAIACTIEQPDVKVTTLTEQEITITASYDDPETRTERAADGAVLWSPGDQISLFYGTGADGGSRFTAQNTEPAKTVKFTGSIGVITGDSNDSVVDYFWAVYPYKAAASCDGNSITTELPDSQVATADTFADDLFPSLGHSLGLRMGFYNICGGLKFTVATEGITSVTLMGNNNEVLAGTITVGLDDNDLPTVTNIANGSKTITVAAPDGETFDVGKAYYIVFVPTVFENGFTLTFKNSSNGSAVYNRTSKTTIRRSAFGTLTTPDAGLEWSVYTPYVLTLFAADMGEYPYVFDTQSRSWNGISNLVATYLGMDYSAFRDSFTWVADKTYYSSNGMRECSGTSDYGSVAFVKSGSGSSINDSFTISLSRAQADNIGNGGSKTLYAQFLSANQDAVYIGFTVRVGAKPTASFSGKNTSFWNSDVNADSNATIRVNVPIPQNYNPSYGGDDVTVLATTIDDYWVGNNVTVNVSPVSAAYSNMQLLYKYEFSSTQPRVGKRNNAIVKSSATSLKYNGTEIIRLNDQESGLVRYLCNDASKELINWASNPSDQDPSSRILYCNVDLVAYYTDASCNDYMELGRQTIHVRFLRPVTFCVDNSYYFMDCVPGDGSALEVGKPFSAEDWQGYKLFWYTNGSYVQGMYSGVSYFGYYGVSKLSIDLDHVATDQAQSDGSFTLLSYVNANAKLGIMAVDNSERAYSGVFDIYLYSLSNLKNYLFIYQNNMGANDDYRLRIPVSLEYAWGTIDAYVYMDVHHTI